MATNWPQFKPIQPAQEPATDWSQFKPVEPPQAEQLEPQAPAGPTALERIGSYAMELLGIGPQAALKSISDLAATFSPFSYAENAAAAAGSHELADAFRQINAAKRASDFFQRGIDAGEYFLPDAYKQSRQRGFIETDEAGNFVGLQAPSVDAAFGTIARSAAQVPFLLAGGSGATNIASRALPAAAQRFAPMVGYGAANAALVAPTEADSIAREAYASAIEAGASEGEAIAQSEEARLKALAMLAPLTGLTGAAGTGLGAMFGQTAKSLPRAVVRGAATEMPFEGIEESGTSAIGDIAQGQEVDLAQAINAGLLGALAGGLQGGAVGGYEYARNRPQIQPRPESQPQPQAQPQAEVAEPITDEDVSDILAALQAAGIEDAAAPEPGPVPQPVAPAAGSQPVAAVSSDLGQLVAGAANPVAQSSAAREGEMPIQDPGATGQAAPERTIREATAIIDQRLEALEEASQRGRMEPAQVKEATAEMQELQELLRDQDTKQRQGINLAPEARLTPQERQQAEQRIIELRSRLEGHRAAVGAGNQLADLRRRLERIDDDAGLVALANTIAPAQRLAGASVAPASPRQQPAPAPSLPESQEFPRASGIPAGLPARQTAASRALAGRLNRYFANRAQQSGQPRGEMRFREIDQAALPDATREAIRAFAEATGTRIAIVRNLTPEIDQFNGVNFGDGVIYVDENADMPVTLAAAHEWLHQLKTDDPAAYQRLEDEVRRQGRLPEWQARMRREGNATEEGKALEELTADAVADAMTDPEFLRRIVRQGGALRRAAESFLRFLDSILDAVRNRGSSQYLRDVQAFRDTLAEVLGQYQNRQAAPTDEQIDAAERQRSEASRQAGRAPSRQQRMVRAARNREPAGGTFDPNDPSILSQSLVDEATGLPLNPDGTVTVYHHTSADKAEAIRKTGQLKSAAEPHVYVTTRREADTGYGDTAVPIRVNPELLQIDDEFPDGRVDYRIDVGRPGGSVKVLVGEYQNALEQGPRGTPDTITADEQGRPLVVYHGTSLKNLQGILKKGLVPKRKKNHKESGDYVYVELSARTARAWARQAGGKEFAVLEIEVPESQLVRDSQTLSRSSFRTERIPARLIKGWDVYRLAPGSGDLEYVRSESNPGFRPEQIKSAIGNRGTFDPKNPNILFQRRTVGEAVAQAEAKRHAANEGLGDPRSGGVVGWQQDKSKWIGTDKALRVARENLQDKFISLRDVIEDIEKARGEKISDLQNAYRIENLMHGKVQARIRNEIDRRHLEPLFSAMRDAGVSLDELSEYLEAKHAQERNRYIAEINPSMPDGGSGLTNRQAEEMLARMNAAKLEPLAQRVYALQRETRRRLLDSGVISKEQYDAMESQYDFYVPLRGKEESDEIIAETNRGGLTGRGIEQRGSGIQRAMGRGAGNRAQNILGEVIGDAQRSVIAAEKARVGRALARLVLANPNPDFWQIEAVRTERKIDAQGMVYEAIANESAQPDVVHVLIKGKPYRIRIANKHIIEALKNLGATDIHAVLRPFAIMNRYVSATVTSYSPGFLALNLARDATFATMRIGAEDGPAMLAKTLAYYTTYAPAVLAADEAGIQIGGKAGQRIKEFVGAGTKTGFVSAQQAEDIQRIVREIEVGKGPKALTVRSLRSVLRFVESANVVVENAMRLAYFSALRDSGMSIDQAAEKAKNLTVNFNRKGKFSNVASAMYMFFNPSVQGVHQVLKLSKNPKIIGTLGVMAAAQFLAAMLAAGIEDENGETLDNKVPDFVKQRNFWVVIPGKRDANKALLPGEQDRIYTWPMPYGFNMFTYAASLGQQFHTDAMADVANGVREPSSVAMDYVGRLASAASMSFSPIPLDEGMGGLIPTIPGQIAAGLLRNKDGLGRPISQPQFDTINPEPKAYNPRPQTPEAFNAIARGLNFIGGGDEVKRPFAPLDWSGEEIQYLYRWATGGAGSFLEDTISGAFNMLNDPEALETKPTPVVRAFTRPVDPNSAAMSAYWERANTIELAVRRIKLIAEREGIEAASEYADSLPFMRGVSIRQQRGGGIEIRPGSSDVYWQFKESEKRIKALRDEARAIWAEDRRPLSVERSRALREIAKRQADEARNLAAEWNWAVRNFAEKEE